MLNKIAFFQFLSAKYILRLMRFISERFYMTKMYFLPNDRKGNNIAKMANFTLNFVVSVSVTK